METVEFCLGLEVQTESWLLPGTTQEDHELKALDCGSELRPAMGSFVRSWVKIKCEQRVGDGAQWERGCLAYERPWVWNYQTNRKTDAFSSDI